MRYAHAGTRLRVWAVIPLAILAATTVLSGCGTTSVPSASSLLSRAQQQFDSNSSVHFVLTVQNYGQGSVASPVVVSATGDAVRPDRVKASAQVNVGVGVASVQLIIIGPQEWYTDPLTGAFTPTTQFSSFLKIFDPTVGLGALLVSLQKPGTPSDGSANGTACWKITGQLSKSSLEPIFGSDVVNDASHTTFCIAKSGGQLASVTMTGAVLAGDTSQTVRTIDFSHYNEQVTIQAPVD